MASVGICQAICLVFEPDVMKSLRSVGRGLTRSRTALAGGGREGIRSPWPVWVALLGLFASPISGASMKPARTLGRPRGRPPRAVMRVP